jgi:O-antigen ligase
MIVESAKRTLINVFGTRKVSNWSRIGFLVSFLLCVAVGIGIVSSANPFLGVGLLLLGGLFALSVARPIIGGLSIVLSSPLNVFAWDGLGFNVRLCGLFTVATLLGISLQLLLGRRKFLRTALDWPILVFWLVLAVTLQINGGNRFGYVLLLVFGYMAVMYFVLVNILRDERTVRVAVDLLVLIGDVVAGVGFLQVAGQYLGLQGEFFRAIHFDVIEFGRPMGTFTDPGWFGIYTMFVFLLLLSLVSNQSGWRRSFFSASLVIQIVAIILSSARAAWVGALVGIFIFILMQRGHKRRSSIRTALYLLFSIFIIVFVWGQLSPNTFGSFVERLIGVDVQSSAQSRILVTQMTLDALDQKLLFGYGLGSWENPLLDEKVRMGPTMVISLIHDAGIMGLVSWVWLLITLFTPLIVNAWHTKITSISPYNDGILLGLLGIFISFQFSSGYNYEWFWVAIAFGGAVAEVSKKLPRRNHTHTPVIV